MLVDVSLGYINKGVALRQLQRYDEAIECFDTVLKDKPDHLQALQYKSQILADQKKYKESVVVINEVGRKKHFYRTIVFVHVPNSLDSLYSYCIFVFAFPRLLTLRLIGSQSRREKHGHASIENQLSKREQKSRRSPGSL